MYSLSLQLRTKARDYFSRRFGSAVSDEEVEQYLINLTHLYDLFNSKD